MHYIVLGQLEYSCPGGSVEFVAVGLLIWHLSLSRHESTASVYASFVLDAMMGPLANLFCTVIAFDLLLLHT